ncbi:DUF6233 domain-containing protein [Streptomyces sp. VRA16 Mangrove soil]|nr:DUF6233 domain-containing protein [Streptomyces sp. VRA16 Mangrove soil]
MPRCGKSLRGAGRDQVRQALAASVDACPYCRPDTALGLLG